MKLTASSTINELRQAIYERCGLAHYSKGYRSKKLRKVCPQSVGLDLRRKTDVIYLAEQLSLIDHKVIHLNFGAKAA